MAKAEPFLHTPLDQTLYPAIASLRAALDLYSRRSVARLRSTRDFYADWLNTWRTKYQRQALISLARLVESYGRAGQSRRMEALARRQLELDPDREIAHLQLMRAHLAQGEYMAALRHYAAYEERLAEYGKQLTAVANAAPAGNCIPPASGIGSRRRRVRGTDGRNDCPLPRLPTAW